MKKKTLILIIFAILCNHFCQAQKYSTYNICIGKGAGMFFTIESYCVIVGHSKEAQALKGKDLIWHVEWNEPYLQPEMKRLLFKYYKNYILAGKDNKCDRIQLALNAASILKSENK